jgi:hypothetical protein
VCAFAFCFRLQSNTLGIPLLVLHFFDFAGDLCAVICELSSYPSKMNENRHSGMHSGGAPRGDWGDAKAVTGIRLLFIPPHGKSSK